MTLAAVAAAIPARAQEATAPTSGPQPTICGSPVPPPARLPPAGSPPVVYQIAPCFEKQGGVPMVDAETYLYYINLRPSRPSQDHWVPYDDTAEQTILADFRRLWATNFLDDLSIEVKDYQFSNGVIGKLIVYNMEERQRIRIVDYVGSRRVEQSKIEERLKEKGIVIRLDSFIDPGTVRRVAGVVRDLYAERGYQYAEVRPEIREVAGGPKLVHLTFHINEGPRVQIRDVEFLGNRAVSDRRLERRMKENKSRGLLSFITGGGTYKADMFEEDADRILEYYRDRGYIMARVGQPELQVLEDSEDGTRRYVRLRIPVTEGQRYRVGEFTFAGNEVVPADALRPLFRVNTGDIYSEKRIRRGLEKAREVYGAGGYFEFVGYPDLQPRDMAGNGDGNDGDAGPPPPSAAAAGPPVVDVTLRVQEGQQYFVNRITFTGNTTTRDNVIRREMRLVESAPFNTEALKYSIRRLNQLGYFKNLEGNAINVEKTPNADNKVDVTLKFEEQNRNQLTFGAGVSQFEGFFGQLSFQTANFMGRGETFTVTAQQGSRAKNYQVAFTEPFLFDRPMSAGIDLYHRQFRYPLLYTHQSTGGNLVYGFQVRDFSRMFISYSLERAKVLDLNDQFFDESVLARNPFLQDSLLMGQGGRRTISKIGPSFVFNTIDNPIFPSTGKRYTLSFEVAGLGGNTNFYNPTIEGIWYFQHTRRTSFGFRAQAQYVAPYGSTQVLPIFEKIFLGGEYSIRGFDLRTVGPRDPGSNLVLGGNKSLLFNAEYLISIAGPVRLVLFADAGQVRDVGESFAWREDVKVGRVRGGLFVDPFDPFWVSNPLLGTLPVDTVVVGEAAAFKASVGAEIRFFMPVLNVPFRLIFAHNPSRTGVLDNSLRPERGFKFRFAVGSTF